MFRSETLTFTLILCVFALGSIGSVPAQNHSFSFESFRSLLDQKAVGFLVLPVPGKEEDFIGLNYIKGVSLLVVYATAPGDNASFVQDSITEGNQRKAYQDLTMMQGNRYTMLSDFQLNGLVARPDSGDFVRQNGTTLFMSKGFAENGFDSQMAFEQYLAKLNEDYRAWLQIAHQHLRR